MITDLVSTRLALLNYAPAVASPACDLTMRATRSLLQLLSRRPPKELVLISPPTRQHDVELSEQLNQRTRHGTLNDLANVDVLSMCGLAPKLGADHLDDGARSQFVLTEQRIRSMADDAIVLSPMPVIDEIDSAARLDPRLRMFHQSDLSVYVRMAIVELLLAG